MMVTSTDVAKTIANKISETGVDVELFNGDDLYEFNG